MAEVRKPHLPIGYWIKKADEALTASINKAQEENDLSRTDWQVLNALQEMATTTREQLAEVLHPFADAATLGEIIDRLVSAGLVEGMGTAGAGYRLTGQGQRVYEAALRVQKEVRQQAVRGISEADYATTVRVLQQIVENLTGERSASL